MQRAVVPTLIRLCSKLVAWTRFGSLLRRLVWRHRVGIALYHNVDPQIFESHLAILKRNYNLIPLDLLADALVSGDWGRVPHNALVITFDDGMKEFYGLGRLLAEHHVPATVYLVSNLVGTRRHFWFNEVKDPQLAESLMRKGNGERLVYLSRHMGYTDDREYEERQALSIDEIHDLAASGVQFGAHTASHPILPACDDVVAQREVVEGKADLEAKTGLAIEHFCYPNGDYTAREEALVRGAGYRSARTVERGLNDRATNAYCLKIVDVLEDRSSADLELIECRLIWYGIKRWFGERRSEYLPPEKRGT